MKGFPNRVETPLFPNGNQQPEDRWGIRQTVSSGREVMLGCLRKNPKLPVAMTFNFSGIEDFKPTSVLLSLAKASYLNMHGKLQATKV
jgi:hypothetical protein